MNNNGAWSWFMDDRVIVDNSSSDAQQRRVARVVLGYAQQSREQMAALVRAARDPDWLVRNNATRALAVLARSNAKLAEAIEPET